MTPKYDVYSFGVLLLEVLCGRKQMITNDHGVHEEPDEIIDPDLRKQMDTQSLTEFKSIAYKCLNQQPAERPTMDQVVKELEEALEHQTEHENIEHPADEGTSSNSFKMDILYIPLREIKRATKGFNKEYCFIGSGGFAEVYKAELNIIDIQSLSSIEGKPKKELPRIRKEVAIKKIKNRADEQGKQGFLTEIELLTSCKHSNIVSLLGFSRENDALILVYEYASNGSLGDYLRTNGKRFNLTWGQRLQICLDTANGINYLHTNMEGKPRIIHRDIKSDNILLDENMKAKVADFGLSKFHPMNQQASTVITQNVAGTNYYLDPEYNTSRKYKRESDIYSFGVVLFEVISGRLAYDSIYTSENDMGLAPIARRRFNEGTLKELIDTKMIEEDDNHIFTLNRGPNQDSFDTFSKIAYQCLAETQAKRPTMEVVIKELEKALNLQGHTMVLFKYLLCDIVSATKNFNETYRIGLDTIGTVYKAELDHFGNNSLLATEGKNNGESSNTRIKVAIKLINDREGSQGKQDFIEEVEMRTSYKHHNIVSLLGFCDEGDEMILVYEHVSDRSLDDYLKSIDKTDTFTWTQRLHMCIEIASGLNHLHTKIVNPQRIMHIDIRSANILLDKILGPKIAYFVISKLQPVNKLEIGVKVYYEDPEYETTGKLERESDIYSFGVVLFEIFCGRLAYDTVYIEENDKGLAPIARQCFKDGTMERIMDPRLKEEGGENMIFTSMDTFLKIAYQCLGEAAERPTMEIVANELQRALDLHETLKKLQISLKDIESGTENFSDKNCIGSGRFWKAYKGELLLPHDNAKASGRTTIVAKRWDSKFGQGDHQFRTEVNILFERNHENVIALVGYCNETDEKIIVLEHMSNGSLDRYIKDASLTWMKRLDICIDVASGLEFLHQGDAMLKKVVHRDMEHVNSFIKSPSILLNADWKAKISNFELSSLDSVHQDMEHVNDNAYSPFGYLVPQYKQQGFLTEKSDIYSFGVVLFEILCGRLAWEKDCKDHYQSLGPLAKRCYEEGNLDKIVFEGIKEQIGPQSLDTFAKIAYQCLQDKHEDRPTAHEVVIQLKKALDVQLFSLGSNGVDETVLTIQFPFEDHRPLKLHSIPESRSDNIAKMFDVSNLNIRIKIGSRSSSGVTYGVHFIFKFCGARKSVDKRRYVNLTYKMGDETLHAYFATWREDEWMTIELYRFLNHKESDTNFEFLLERLTQCYHGTSAIYVEGVEVRAIDNVKPEENNNLMDLQAPHMETNNIPFDICSIFTQTLLQLLGWRNKEKQYYMLSANEAFCDSFNANRYNLKLSTESIFQKVAELLSTQVFRIKCKINSKMLLQSTEYKCYLVFKLSENSCGLHCPVKVRDLHQSTDKNTKVVYFRSPRAWNIDDVNQVPQEREDGWMEVYVWKFKSNDGLQNDCLLINLKFESCEGTMAGLIVRGVEFRSV